MILRKSGYAQLMAQRAGPWGTGHSKGAFTEVEGVMEGEMLNSVDMEAGERG